MNHTLYVYIIIRVFFIVSTINFIYMCTIGLPYKKKTKMLHYWKIIKNIYIPYPLRLHFCYVLISLNYEGYSCKKDIPVRKIFLEEALYMYNACTVTTRFEKLSTLGKKFQNVFLGSSQRNLNFFFQN